MPNFAGVWVSLGASINPLPESGRGVVVADGGLAVVVAGGLVVLVDGGVVVVVDGRMVVVAGRVLFGLVLEE